MTGNKADDALEIAEQTRSRPTGSVATAKLDGGTLRQRSHAGGKYLRFEA